MTREPGTYWQYNTPAYQMLFRMIERATGEKYGEYVEKRLFGPLGMERVRWIKDDLPNGLTNYYRLDCSTRDLARYALLLQRGGQWKGERLVSEKYFQEMTTPSQRALPTYGYLTTTNADNPWTVAGEKPTRALPDCPPDGICSFGAQNKIIAAFPGLDLSVARHGPAAGDQGFNRRLLGMICRAAGYAGE